MRWTSDCTAARVHVWEAELRRQLHLRRSDYAPFAPALARGAGGAAIATPALAQERVLAIEEERIGHSELAAGRAQRQAIKSRANGGRSATMPVVCSVRDLGLAREPVATIAEGIETEVQVAAASPERCAAVVVGDINYRTVAWTCLRVTEANARLVPDPRQSESRALMGGSSG